MRRAFGRFIAVTLLATAVVLGATATFADAAPRARHVSFASKPKKHSKKKKSATPKVATLAAATAWLTLGPDAQLIAQGTPQQLTDPTSPYVMQVTALTNGLSFQGLGMANYARTPDPSITTVPIGNYILKVVVFGNAADAAKFRDADAGQVTSKGALKQVDTVPNGVVLDDGQGHVNAMFTVNNAVVDLRTGVSESQPGAGVAEIKKLASMIVANSKKS